MSIFKCKMCGGTLEIQPGQTVAECEYCGTQQTLPKLEDDRRANLYDRANHFRRNNEFDKAMGIYEQILNEDNTDSESYWSLVLCRYGIEYVEDPSTHKRVPTVNRAQFTAIFDDDNYKSALQYADSYQRSIYESEAKAINEIQKGILAISQKEEPFDVFICYKETDNNGRRTPDSVLANDLYHQLTQEGFKVFFARITLEDKLGTAYEPYIFAALNSAKVMVVLGTKPEYFSAVWVKNEWSRYLALIKQGQKKMLIPAYKDMDPYDLPEEFSHLQAQDMSKLGFMQDLIRGIKKITQADAPQATVVKETVVASANASTAALIKRAYMFLEDGDWASADEYCEKVLDIDPENGEAYLGKALAQEKQRKLAAFVQSRKQGATVSQKTLYLQPNQEHIDEMADRYSLAGYVYKTTIVDLYRFDLSYSSSVLTCKAAYVAEQSYWHDHKWLSKAEKYLTGAVAEEYAMLKKSLFDTLQQRLVDAEREHAEAVAKLERDYAAHIQQADEKAKALYEEGMNRKNTYYRGLVESAEKSEKISEWRDIAKKLQALGDYKDSISLAEHYRQQAEAEQARIDAERAQAAENARKEAEKRAKHNERVAIITIAVVCVLFAFMIVLNTVIIPNIKYNKAMEMIDAGNVVEAYEALIALDGYKDSAETADAIRHAYPSVFLQYAQAGDYILFGTYEQDNNQANGKEYIEWLVLEIKDGKALIISKYALDCQPYNADSASVTWETCSLRQWLNDDFINEAFNTEEQSLIPTVTVSADKNPLCSTNPGASTQDKVFLLSITEVNKHLTPVTASSCQPTDYAVANGADVDSANRTSWWLRSPGFSRNRAAFYDFDIFCETGTAVYSSNVAVRPALWINLSASE